MQIVIVISPDSYLQLQRFIQPVDWTYLSLFWRLPFLGPARFLNPSSRASIYSR